MEPNTLAQGFTTIAGNIKDGITSIAPIAISVMGVKMVWKIGARFFGNLANK